MTFSLRPLLLAVAGVGFLVGGLGGAWLASEPPCPTPRPPCAECDCTPAPCPEPGLVPASGPEAESPESAFYRGWLASCISNGQLAGAPMEATVKYCGAHLRYGIGGDWYGDFRPDNWTWPPDWLEPDATPPAKKRPAAP